MSNETPNTDETFVTPSAKVINAAVEEYDGIERAYVELPTNFADKEETVKAYQLRAYNAYTRFAGQTSRNDLITYLKNADAKLRMSIDNAYKDDSSQKQNTLSHVVSPQFYNSVKRIWTGLMIMIFGDGQEIPARYEKIVDSDDYTAAEGQRIAEEETLHFETVYRRNNWETWLKDSMFWLEKNAHEFIGLEWAYETDTRRERLPGFYTKDKTPMEARLEEGATIVVSTGKAYAGNGYDVNGNPVAEVYEGERPISFVFMDKTRIIQNNPVPLRYNLEDVYLDLDIKSDVIDPNKDCVQRQQCIVIHDQVTLDELIKGERDGLYKNVSQISTAQLYEHNISDNGDEDLPAEKDANADQTTDPAKNGLYDRYRVQQRSPIDPITGKWDDNASLPVIHEAVFIGKLSAMPQELDADGKQKGAVCIMLRKNPYDHKRFPYKLLFSHKDDRAAVHMGTYTLLECNIEEQTTTMNQDIDCKTLMVKKPWKIEQGSVKTTDLIFKGGNQAIIVKPGRMDGIEQLKVDDITATTLTTLDYLEKQADKTVDTPEAVSGEYAGSRTTGYEVSKVTNQALQPAIEKARFVSNQYFHFFCRDFSDLGRQFADPSRKIPIENRSGEVDRYVSPSELYGNLNVKIVTIDKFEADLTLQQNLNNFLQSGGYDKAAPFMGKEGALKFWRIYGRFMQIPDVKEVFPAAKKQVEAENQAWADVSAIYADPDNAMQDEALLPKEGEIHEVHLGILRTERDKLSVILPTMPTESDEDKQEQDRAKKSLQVLDLYILMHEQLQGKEKENEVQSQGSVMNQSQEPPSMESEAAGDVMSGNMGQQTQGI